MGLARRSLGILLAAICLYAIAAAQSGPRPPCEGDPLPAFPKPGAEPAIQTWEHTDWNAPACVGWSALGSSTLIATAGRFRNASGWEALRPRIGAVSKLTGLLYWSTTNKRWQPLILEAHAVTAASGDRRRADFSMTETAEGRTIYAEQEDNLLGRAIYRIRIMRASADHLTVATDNISPVQSLGIPLFRTGEIESITFLDHEQNEVWSYYSLVRMSGFGTTLLSGRAASLVNRAAALYRHLAGIPADQEPPAAP